MSPPRFRSSTISPPSRDSIRLWREMWRQVLELMPERVLFPRPPTPEPDDAAPHTSEPLPWEVPDFKSPAVLEPELLEFLSDDLLAYFSGEHVQETEANERTSSAPPPTSTNDGEVMQTEGAEDGTEDGSSALFSDELPSFLWLLLVPTTRTGGVDIPRHYVCFNSLCPVQVRTLAQWHQHVSPPPEVLKHPDVDLWQGGFYRCGDPNCHILLWSAEDVIQHVWSSHTPI